MDLRIRRGPSDSHDGIGHTFPFSFFHFFGPLPTSERDATTTSKFQEVLDAAVASGYPDAIAAVLTPQGAGPELPGSTDPGPASAPDDVFAIASITKTFTSALIMRLAEQGKIDLDRPLSTSSVRCR